MLLRSFFAGGHGKRVVERALISLSWRQSFWTALVSSSFPIRVMKASTGSLAAANFGSFFAVLSWSSPQPLTTTTAKSAANRHPRFPPNILKAPSVASNSLLTSSLQRFDGARGLLCRLDLAQAWGAQQLGRAECRAPVEVEANAVANLDRLDRP